MVHLARSATWRAGIRESLLRWFDQNARDLPWRRDPTAYHVWVSELMAQQTQIATVVPYWHRWMERFPDVETLAAAEEADVMRLWEGLGYYRRARSLHAGAKRIVDQFGGRFPMTYQDVSSLPGVGRYTAGAILSIAGNQAYPILEGNTVRVFSRWIGLAGDPTAKANQTQLWSFAESMLPRRKGGDRARGPAAFNQAAMELGALVCVRRPNCGDCPVANRCAARRDGLTDQIPGKVSKVTYTDRREFAFVVRNVLGDRVLLRTLPAGVRWAGLDDVPRVGPPQADGFDAAAAWLRNQIGEVQLTGPRQTIRHGVTRYRITLEVHDAVAVGVVPEPWRWVAVDRLGALPLSKTGRQILGSS